MPSLAYDITETTTYIHPTSRTANKPATPTHAHSSSTQNAAHKRHKNLPLNADLRRCRRRPRPLPLRPQSIRLVPRALAPRDGHPPAHPHPHPPALHHALPDPRLHRRPARPAHDGAVVHHAPGGDNGGPEDGKGAQGARGVVPAGGGGRGVCGLRAGRGDDGRGGGQVCARGWRGGVGRGEALGGMCVGSCRKGEGGWGGVLVPSFALLAHGIELSRSSGIVVLRVGVVTLGV